MGHIVRTQKHMSIGKFARMSAAPLKERLRQALDARGLKITEAAELTGIPYRSMQNYLRGEREPGADALTAITTRLGISTDWLLTGEGGMYRGGGAAGLATETPREEAVLTLFRDLDEDAQREIQRAAEEKKRLREVERRLDDLSAALQQAKKPA